MGAAIGDLLGLAAGVAVALTLLRACDRVAGLSFAIPMPSAADGPDQVDPTTP
jgi:hypothetical protein